MYAAIMARRMVELRDGMWRTAIMHSGVLTLGVVALVLLGLGLGWKAHKLGRFSQLKSELKMGPVSHAPAAPQPGGQEAVSLERSQVMGGSAPEFVSATLLPGRGMNTLQLTAYLPGKGEVKLLDSPDLEGAAARMTGMGADANGMESLKMGGALETPWANRIFGAPSADGQTLTTVWQRRHLTLPADDGTAAMGGLLLKHASNTEKMNVMPDGGEAVAVFQAGDFNGHWPSKTEITTTVLLSSRSLDMKVVARNVGDEPEPMGIGWAPRFVIPSGSRGQVMLRMSSGLHAEVLDRQTGLPSGRLLPVAGTPYDFTGRNGARLGDKSLDDSFVHLRTAFLDNGPMAELRDPESNYGVRVTAMTSTIKAMRLYAPEGSNFVSIEPQFNYDDPFGREWAKDEDTGMVVLQPGQSVQWRVRVELFLVTSEGVERMPQTASNGRFDPAQRTLVQ
jgi:aldose 1-epimerase